MVGLSFANFIPFCNASHNRYFVFIATYEAVEA